MMDANWFQQALDRAGVSQADLARQLRLAPSAISRMMKGERNMKLLEAVQIAAFLGVPQEEVLRNAGAIERLLEPGRVHHLSAINCDIDIMNCII